MDISVKTFSNIVTVTVTYQQLRYPIRRMSIFSSMANSLMTLTFSRSWFPWQRILMYVLLGMAKDLDVRTSFGI